MADTDDTIIDDSNLPDPEGRPLPVIPPGGASNPNSPEDLENDNGGTVDPGTGSGGSDDSNNKGEGSN